MSNFKARLYEARQTDFIMLGIIFMLFIMTLIIRPSPERSRGINSNYENVYHETGTITLQNGAALTVGTSLAMTEVTVEGAGGFKKTNRIIYGDDGDPGVNTVLSEFTEVP